MPSFYSEAFRAAPLQVAVDRYPREGDEAYSLLLKLGSASDAPCIDLHGLTRADIERVGEACRAALADESGGVILAEVGEEPDPFKGQ